MKLNFKKADIVRADEKEIYSGEKKKTRKFLVEIIILAVIGLIAIAGDGFLIGASVITKLTSKEGTSSIIVFAICFVLHMVPEAAWAFSILRRRSLENNTYYIITDKRAIIVYNLPVTEVKYYDLDKTMDITCDNGDFVLTINEEKVKLLGIDNCESIVQRLTRIRNKQA